MAEQKLEEKKNLEMLPMKHLLDNLTIDPVQIWYGTGGWLPGPELLSLWRQNLKSNLDMDQKLLPSVQKLADLIESDKAINKLTNEMMQQSLSLDKTFAMNSINEFLFGINSIIQTPIRWQSKGFIGIPLAAWFAGVDATLAGQTLFRYPSWNDCIRGILDEWNASLNKQASWPTSETENTWFNNEALQAWPKGWGPLDLWQKPEKKYPYWKSWNDWFARDFADKDKSRPIAGKGNPNIITSTNDGVEFRWRTGIKLSDNFWLKNMPYSLTQIFDEKEDSAIYAKRFEHGSIFQTFLNPFNYHCWWSPVSGKIIEAKVINGYFYSKLVLPDIDGSTTASCPYLTQVNTRGIVIIDTKETIGIGYVCCIPIGMCEVSSIKYEENIKKGCQITKGDKLGKFQFGGSSFAIIFEDALKYNKLLTFMADQNLKATGTHYFPMNAPAPTVSGNDKSIQIKVGSQIAVISDYPKSKK